MTARTRTLRPYLTSGTGLVCWRLPDSALEIMWSGPGAGLYIGWATTPGGAVTRINHPTANGQYMTRREAQAHVDEFVEACAA